MIGTTEIVLIAGVALLLFGGKKLPELMKGMGQGVRNFKEGLHEQPEDAPHAENTDKAASAQANTAAEASASQPSSEEKPTAITAEPNNNPAEATPTDEPKA